MSLVPLSHLVPIQCLVPQWFPFYLQSLVLNMTNSIIITLSVYFVMSHSLPLTFHKVVSKSKIKNSIQNLIVLTHKFFRKKCISLKYDSHLLRLMQVKYIQRKITITTTINITICLLHLVFWHFIFTDIFLKELSYVIKLYSLSDSKWETRKTVFNQNQHFLLWIRIPQKQHISFICNFFLT